jgi:hypothetical protein
VELAEGAEWLGAAVADAVVAQGAEVAGRIEGTARLLLRRA